ncbi:MAG: methionyl-tRNA formyltransferase [Pseudomonadota bacterium]
MRIVFAGTPAFAATHLQALLAAGHQVIAVYTQPDRRAGRGRQWSCSPVKALALEHGLPVCQPASLRDPAAQAGLAAWAPELMVVVAYGLILPPAVLDLPRLGCINVHASLLPRWRGAAPIQRAILAGDRETGIAIMRMDAGLDTGPLLAAARCPIAPDDTGGSLQDKLAALGPPLLLEVLAKLARGPLPAQPQDEHLATYAPKIDRAEAAIDWRESAQAVERKVRAFDPVPVAHTSLGGVGVRIWAGTACTLATPAAPGTVLAADREGILVACGAGAYRIRELQLEGRRRLAAAEVLNSRAGLFTPGAVFDR